MFEECASPTLFSEVKVCRDTDDGRIESLVYAFRTDTALGSGAFASFRNQSAGHVTPKSREAARVGHKQGGICRSGERSSRPLEPVHEIFLDSRSSPSDVMGLASSSK